MSNQIYPTLPGLAWPTTRIPSWSTTVKEADSGRKFGVTTWTSPRWTYKLKYEFLREWGQAEWQQLVGFFNAHRGDWDTWLYDDPDDNTATDAQFGIGNGTTLIFQLMRTLGGISEPIYELNGVPAISVTDYQGKVACSTLPRTNYVVRSSQTDQWTKYEATVTADNVAGPDGTLTGDSWNFSGVVNGRAEPTIPLAAVAGDVITASVWLKGAGTINLVLSDASANSSEKTVTLTPAWVRHSITYTMPAGVSGNVRFYPVKRAGSTATGLQIWGAQVEKGAAPGRYIATTTAARTLTDVSVSKGQVTFAEPPAAAAALSWSGQYYWRCRFVKSSMEFEQFMKQLWSAKTVEFTTEKPS